MSSGIRSSFRARPAMAQPAWAKIKLKIFAERDRLLQPDGPGGHGKVRRSATDLTFTSGKPCLNPKRHLRLAATQTDTSQHIRRYGQESSPAQIMAITNTAGYRKGAQ